eukprot:763395-Hanusia_phi.AAC.2
MGYSGANLGLPGGRISGSRAVCDKSCRHSGSERRGHAIAFEPNLQPGNARPSLPPMIRPAQHSEDYQQRAGGEGGASEPGLPQPPPADPIGGATWARPSSSTVGQKSVDSYYRQSAGLPNPGQPGRPLPGPGPLDYTRGGRFIPAAKSVEKGGIRPIVERPGRTVSSAFCNLLSSTPTPSNFTLLAPIPPC